MEKPQSIPESYDRAINDVIKLFEKMDNPKFKGFIKITVRPAGSKTSISKDIYQNGTQMLLVSFPDHGKKIRRVYGNGTLLPQPAIDHQADRR